ncbi:MAG: hypothetical protein ACFWTL_05785 [Atopobium sp.]
MAADFQVMPSSFQPTFSRLLSSLRLSKFHPMLQVPLIELPA